jgi:hypothetical protein
MKKFALRLLQTDLPGTYAVCELSIINSRILETLFDKAFVIIFESQLESAIGLQFFISPVSFPSLGYKVINDS